MANYIVSYDLQRPGQHYQAVERYLRSMPAYSKVLETVWVIRSDVTAETIRDQIARLVDGNDKVFVAQVGGARGLNIDTQAWLIITQIGAA